MSFDTLARQSPMGPLAESYSARCLALSAAALADREVRWDIPFGPQATQRLDVILPHGKRPAGGWPVLLFFHGGGFTHGYKEWGGFMAPALGDVVLVLADYRLVPDVSRDALLDDAELALRWAANHAAGFGGDPNRLYVGGHSAGGALAALLALAPPPEGPVAGAICLSTSFGRLAITGTPGSDYSLPPGPLPIDEDAPLAKAAMAGSVRFFIGWGGQERQRERVERSSMAMLSALRDRGAPVAWQFLADADHFQTHLLFANPEHEWARRLRRWLAGA